MFSSWWKGSTAFSCDLGEEIKLNGRLLGAGSFGQLHSGTQKTTSNKVSVFVCSESDSSKLASAHAAVKKLKTLRHPSVVLYIDSSQESEKPPLLCATETVEPLLIHLTQGIPDDLEDQTKAQYLSWGILQVFRGVAFLHEANLVHGSLHAGSVFVTLGGEWKLFGFEQMKSTQNANDSVVKSHWPALNKYLPPELQKNPGLEPNPAQDMWGLGCLIWEVYNGTLNHPNDLAETENIPKKLSSTYMELVAANSAKRPNPGEKIKILSSGPNAFFKNDIIEVCTFLEELQIKDDHEKSRFWTSLPSKLDNIPEHVCVHKILPECIKAFDFSNAGAVILAPVFKIGKFLNTDDYQARIVPCIVKLFSSSDRNARFKLLTQIEHFVEHLSNKVVNNDVFPQIQNGFLDKEPIIREKTVIAMIHLAPKLNFNNLDETVVMKHFSRLLRDEQAGIRTNTAVCLGKIARYLHYSTRQKVLIPAFGGKMKDPFPPARIAAINGLAATQQFYTILETSGKIVPILCPLLSDPEKPVREQAFKVVEGFMDKLKQVSEQPELKEEMEREVMSTNTQVLTQTAASWANWAVGAIGAKFYKSANKPPPTPETTSKESTPVRNETPKTTDEQVKKPSAQDIKAPATTNNKTVDNDGWDDDDADWGSLEDSSSASFKIEDDDNLTKKDQTNNTAAKQDLIDFDSWSSDMLNKPQDKTSIVKQGVQTLQLDEWDSWGNDASAPALDNDLDDKKKQREEKRLQRQKEIEAKRAARRGPMKLGAKKPSNDLF